MSRAWLPHLLLCAWMLLCVAVHAGTQRSSDQLLQLAEDSTADSLERASALRQWAVRSSADRQGVERLAEELLSSPDRRLRLLSAGSDLLRFGAGERMGPPPIPPMAAEQVLASMNQMSAQDWLWFVLYRRKVGGMQVGAKRRLDLQEARWTLDALADKAPPLQDVRKHVRRRSENAWRGPR